MNKRKKNTARTVALLIALVMIVSTILMGLPLIYGASDTRVYAAAKDVTDSQSLQEEMEFMSRLIEALREIYKDEVSYETLVNGAYEGIFQALGDPYSDYYDAKDEKIELEEQVSGEFDGVGLSLHMGNNGCEVTSPIAGSPAERAGFKKGDIIIAVDGIDLTGKALKECTSMIRGAAGTEVTLRVKRSNAVLEFTIVREKIRTDAVNWKMLDNNIAYVQITQIDKDAHREFRQATKAVKEQGATSMILDLRNNPGGYVNVACDIVNMIVPASDATIMTMTRQGEALGSITTTGAGKKFDMPLVVLINGGSASASEIIAGALQDNKAATLVGTTTYGKGIAQTVTDLKNGGAMKVSTYYFTTPDGHTIHGKGIVPDVQVINSVGAEVEELQEQYSRMAPMKESVKYRKGQTGLNVYAAQQRLNLLGENLSLTGTMDEATVAAVKKFQKEAGMCPYGGLDYSTMAAIENGIAEMLSETGEDAQLAKAIEILSK